MTKILFINPPLTLQERYGKLATAGSLEPPHGLCNLAAVTMQNNFDTEIIDAPGLGLDYDRTIKVILDKNPDYIGITAVTISISNANLLAQKIKEKNNKITIIIGGPHLTALPEETLKEFIYFDIGVIGEGEITVIDLLNTLEKKDDLAKVKGIVFRKNSSIVITSPREFIKDLDQLPLPAWNLLPHITDLRPAAASCNRLPSTSMISTRGCHARCIFCDRSGFGEIVRAHSPAYVMKMIHTLQKNYGIKDIRIMDDNFFLIKTRFQQICERIITEKLDLTWSCDARVDTVDEESLRLAKKAGCWQIAYGLESGSQKILDTLCKGTTIEKIEQAISWTKKAGIRSLGYFMIGNPGETKETIEATLKLVMSIPLDDMKITFFTPYPGSRIYKNYAQYGQLVNKDWHTLDANLEPVFLVPGLDKDYLIQKQKFILRKFYFRPRIILTYLKRLNNPTRLIPLFHGVRAFLRYIFYK